MIFALKVFQVDFKNYPDTICKYPFAFYTSGNNMMKRTQRLPNIANSGEAGGHLFLIGVA